MLSVYHMTAFTIGFVMDLLFGDPYWLAAASDPVDRAPDRMAGSKAAWRDRRRGAK